MRPFETVFSPSLPTPTLKFENLLHLGGLWEKERLLITFALAFFEVTEMHNVLWVSSSDPQPFQEW